MKEETVTVGSCSAISCVRLVGVDISHYSAVGMMGGCLKKGSGHCLFVCGRRCVQNYL